MSNQTKSARIGILTVSDRASQGVYEDKGGPAIREWFTQALLSPWEAVARVIPDEQPNIEDALIELADVEGCSLIVTTGGTGPALRDVTPEAIADVCQKELPGFGEQMRAASLRAGVPTAILSRQTTTILDRTLMVTLPNKPASIRICLNAMFPAIPYCIDLLDSPHLDGDPAVVQVFRPKS